MGRITVVIPTAARPQTLETTLSTVARQTALEDIERIVVSENLGDHRSEAVCAAFAGLPIDYRLQTPLLSPQAHAARLLQDVSTPYVALVCDDDLWSPGHLDTAVRSLDANPSAGSHFSAFVGAQSELSLQASLWGSPLLWLAAGRPERMVDYEFDLRSILALSWIFTPFQYSTLVARSAVASEAAPSMGNSSHQFYSDRVLCVALARQAPVIFDPAVDTLYRIYGGNWQNTQDPRHLMQLLDVCHKEIEAEAAELGMDLSATWRELLSGAPEEIAYDTKALLRSRFTADEMAAHGFADLLPADPPLASVATRAGARLLRAYNVLRGRATA